MTINEIICRHRINYYKKVASKRGGVTISQLTQLVLDEEVVTAARKTRNIIRRARQGGKSNIIFDSMLNALSGN